MDAVPRVINCQRCGHPTPYQRKDKRYCNFCLEVVNREQTRERMRKTLPGTRSTFRCRDCGAKLKSANAVRCAACNREHRKAAKRQWYAANKETIKARADEADLVPVLPIPTGPIIRRRIDLLIVATVGQCYYDIRHETWEGQHAPPQERAKARQWWKENALDWVESVGLDIPLPKV